jgi:acetyltransferase-like isoleucine patch superfamily enzyme
MKSKKYIIGKGDLLEHAISDWKDLDTGDILIGVEISLKEGRIFDLSSLYRLSPDNATAFIAWGSDFMNFQRLELFMELKKLGFKLPPLISQNSHVSRNVKLSENVYLNSGVQISEGVTIGMNTVIMSNVVIDSNVEIGNSCFIDSGVIFKERVRVAEHCIIGPSTLLSELVSIEKFCFIDTASKISSDISMNSYFSKSVNARIY